MQFFFNYYQKILDLMSRMKLFVLHLTTFSHSAVTQEQLFFPPVPYC